MTHHRLQLPQLQLLEQLGVIADESCLGLLASLPQVGGQLESVDMASVVPHHQDWLLLVEGDMVKHALLLGDYGLEEKIVSKCMY